MNNLIYKINGNIINIVRSYLMITENKSCFNKLLHYQKWGSTKHDEMCMFCYQSCIQKSIDRNNRFGNFDNNPEYIDMRNNDTKIFSCCDCFHKHKLEYLCEIGLYIKWINKFFNNYKCKSVIIHNNQRLYCGI